MLAWLVVTLCVMASPNPGFRTDHIQHDQFMRYGAQFGKISEIQYLHMAQQLRDTPAGKAVLESKRRDGGGSKFDAKRGWFVAYDADRTLRTFMIPKDGLKFFDRQKLGDKPPE